MSHPFLPSFTPLNLKILATLAPTWTARPLNVIQLHFDCVDDPRRKRIRLPLPSMGRTLHVPLDFRPQIIGQPNRESWCPSASHVSDTPLPKMPSNPNRRFTLRVAGSRRQSTSFAPN